MSDPWIELLRNMERIADALEHQALVEDDPAGAMHGCAGAYADRLRRMSRGYGAQGTRTREKAPAACGNGVPGGMDVKSPGTPPQHARAAANAANPDSSDVR